MAGYPGNFRLAPDYNIRLTLQTNMRPSSTFILILWLASLGAPLLALAPDECQQTCCADLETGCPMEQGDNDCPFMAVSDPLPSTPALPANTTAKATSLAPTATTLPVILAQQLQVTVLPAQLHPPPPAVRFSPLLI